MDPGKHSNLFCYTLNYMDYTSENLPTAGSSQLKGLSVSVSVKPYLSRRCVPPKIRIFLSFCALRSGGKKQPA